MRLINHYARGRAEEIQEWLETIIGSFDINNDTLPDRLAGYGWDIGYAPVMQHYDGIQWAAFLLRWS